MSMKKLIAMLNEWSNDHIWVNGNPNILVKRIMRIDQSTIRPNCIDIKIVIEDSTMIVNGVVSPFGLTETFSTSMYNPSTNDIPQNEVDRLKKDIYDFTIKVIKTREGHISNWIKAGDKIETTDPLSMK